DARICGKISHADPEDDPGRNLDPPTYPPACLARLLARPLAFPFLRSAAIQLEFLFRFRSEGFVQRGANAMNCAHAEKILPTNIYLRHVKATKSGYDTEQTGEVLGRLRPCGSVRRRRHRPGPVTSLPVHNAAMLSWL